MADNKTFRLLHAKGTIRLIPANQVPTGQVPQLVSFLKWVDYLIFLTRPIKYDSKLKAAPRWLPLFCLPPCCQHTPPSPPAPPAWEASLPQSPSRRRRSPAGGREGQRSHLRRRRRRRGRRGTVKIVRKTRRRRVMMRKDGVALIAGGLLIRSAECLHLGCGGVPTIPFLPSLSIEPQLPKTHQMRSFQAS